MSNKTRKIKGLLMFKGISVTSIAKSTSVSLTFVSLVINGKKKSRRIQQFIADMLGLSYSETWDDDGTSESAAEDGCAVVKNIKANQNAA